MTLQKYLNINHLSQSTFSEKSGIPQAAISRYVSGVNLPSFRNFLKIYTLTNGLVGLEDFLPNSLIDPLPTSASVSDNTPGG